MLFCSEIFLFLFLPVVILLYYIMKPLGIRVRNTILLAASILFYGWGEPKFVYVMIASILLNYIFGLLMYRVESNLLKKLFLSAAVLVNLSLLFVYKYLDFSITNVNALFGTMIPIKNIALPIGISFFTFQAMSYVIDVYRGKEQVQKNPFDLALYVSFFPQLIAGPIVRYETVAAQIRERTETIEMFSCGIRRFIVGLGKKVMLANTLALVSDMAFDMNPELLSTPMAWLGIVAYTLMIYFDFSGYSDMAIGRGKMFGFTFEENFNYPYISGTAGTSPCPHGSVITCIFRWAAVVQKQLHDVCSIFSLYGLQRAFGTVQTGRLSHGDCFISCFNFLRSILNPLIKFPLLFGISTQCFL